MQAQMHARELILYAVRAEKASFALYTRAAAAADQPAVAGLLNQLARDEMGHLLNLLQRYSPQFPDLLAAVDIALPTPDGDLVERLGNARSVEDVLQMALREERHSLATYGQLATAITSAARPVWQSLMRRERRHIALLEAMVQRPPVADPGSGEEHGVH